MSGYLVALPFLAGWAMGAVARRGGAAGRVLAIALPAIVLALVALQHANGLATTAVLWGGAVAVMVYAVAASHPRRASGAGNLWGHLSRVVGVVLLFFVGAGPAPSVTDAVLLGSGTVLLLGPFLIAWPRAMSPEPDQPV